jgi:predicted permease
MRVLAILRYDLRDAFRGLKRSPGFALTVIVTLGLGIGANVTMFDLADRLMFRPLAFLRAPSSVHRIYWQWQDRGVQTTTTSTSYPRVIALQQHHTSFAAVAAFFETQLPIGEGDETREQRVGAVSASFFDFFDAQPVLGRFFSAAEDTVPRGADVVVLSHRYWQAAYGGRDALGETLRIGNVRAVIVGVAPQGFDGVNDANPPSLYIPITTYASSTGTDDSRTYFNRYHWGWVNVLVRRNAGVSHAQAEADATQSFLGTWDAARADNAQLPPLDVARPHVVLAGVRPGAGPDPSLEARTALWLSLVAGIVLVIACANVANLLLARTVQHAGDFAIRRALGVGVGRLATLALGESLTLTLCGAMGGLLIASWSMRILSATVLPAPASPGIAHARTLMFATAASLVVAVVIALIPLYRAGSLDIMHTLRGVRGGTRSRLQTPLLIMQAALSIVLLIGAALFVRSLQAVTASRAGYDAEQVLLVSRIIRGSAFTDDVQRAARSLLLGTAQSLPGVDAAAWVSSAPFISTSSTTLFVEGHASTDNLGPFSFQATTPDYFRTMGTRILRGRGLRNDDRLGAAPVALVSESMAAALWPRQNAIGRCFRMRDPSAQCVTVVGVAEDIVQRDFTDGRRHHFYLSSDQYTRSWGNGLVIRVHGDPAREAEAIRVALQRVLPADAAYLRVQPLRHLVATAQRSWRLGAVVFVVFASLTLVLAAVGLYGMIRYNVAQRLHELGVRAALGAERRDLVALIVRQGVVVAVSGALVGIPLAMAGARWIQPLLFEQRAIDVTIYTSVVLAMLAVAVAASISPAIGAANADPSVTLRRT